MRFALPIGMAIWMAALIPFTEDWRIAVLLLAFGLICSALALGECWRIRREIKWHEQRKRYNTRRQ